jgi:methionyl-tRNA synthetase
VIYVWFDALCNYVTALGYGPGGEAYRRWWAGSGDRVHLLGERLDAVLGVLLEACSVLGRVLTPFLPDAAARITLQCTPGRDGRLPSPSPVFRRLSIATAAGRP